MSAGTEKANSMSVTWSSAGSEAVIYVVIWSSDQCPDDVDDGNTTITDGSTSYTIEVLRGGTLYTITLVASNTMSSEHMSIGKKTRETGIHKSENAVLHIMRKYSTFSLYVYA